MFPLILNTLCHIPYTVYRIPYAVYTIPKPSYIWRCHFTEILLIGSTNANGNIISLQCHWKNSCKFFSCCMFSIYHAQLVIHFPFNSKIIACHIIFVWAICHINVIHNFESPMGHYTRNNFFPPRGFQTTIPCCITFIHQRKL